MSELTAQQRARIAALIAALKDAAAELEGRTQPTRDDLLRLISSDKCVDNESDLSPCVGIADTETPPELPAFVSGEPAPP